MWSKNCAVAELLLGCLLSGPLAADITLTQLANEGVIIESGQTRIMIDGMVVEPYAVYGGLPPAAVPDFRAARGDFADIDLALVSHRHHEHNQPEFACDFMQASDRTRLVSGSQVLGLMREKCRDFVTTSPRVREIDPQYGAPHVIEEPGFRVTVFPLSHGVRKYARIQNYGHLVEIGGMTVLHVGDAAADPTDFERAGLADRSLDVALIPFGYFQPGPGADIVNRFLDAPLKIAVHIPPGEMEEVQAYLAENWPKVHILARPLEQLRFSAAAPPPP